MSSSTYQHMSPWQLYFVAGRNMRKSIVVIDLHNLYEAHVFLVSVLWSTPNLNQGVTHTRSFTHKQHGGQLVPISWVSISITTALINPFDEWGRANSACGKLVKVILRAGSLAVPSPNSQVPLMLASRSMEARSQLLSLKRHHENMVSYH